MSRPPLIFPDTARLWLDPFLPKAADTSIKNDGITAQPHRPHVTLTYACSLDAALTGAPGQQTWISGPESTGMTHYLRATHDAILVGVGTAIAADPALNCRLSDAGPDQHPRPVIIDPKGRWALDDETCNVIRTAKRGLGKGPWIVSAVAPSEQNVALLRAVGGRYVVLPGSGDDNLIDWTLILETLDRMGIASVMIEGGAHVINTLLAPVHKHLIDSVVVTVAPCWLGTGSVTASPSREGVGADPSQAFAHLQDVTWNQLGRDVILCGRVKRT